MWAQFWLNVVLCFALIFLNAHGLWDRSVDPHKRGWFFARITPHGWVTLVLVFVCGTLSIGVQALQTEATRKGEVEKAVEKAKAEQARYALQAEVVSQHEQLRNQSEQLSDQGKLLVDQSKSLAHARDDVKSAKEEALSQSEANLVTVFANANRTVRDIYVGIPLTARARVNKTFRTTLLPDFTVPACSDLTGLGLAILTEIGGAQVFNYFPGHAVLEQKYAKVERYSSDEDIDAVRADRLLMKSNHDQADAVGIWKSSVGPTTSNGIVLQMSMHVLDRSISVAQIYSALAQQNYFAPVTISTSWPGYFDFADSEPGSKAYALMDAYPQIYRETIGFESNSLYGIRPKWSRKPVYPKACSVQLEQYLRVAFEKAALILVLNPLPNEENGPTLAILFQLHARSPQMTDEGGSLAFLLEGQPHLVVEREKDLTDIFDAAWRSSDLNPTKKR